MTTVHHINCGWLHAPPNPRASCHCLLLEDAGRLALVDTGIGLLDAERLGRPLVELAGFLFNESDTAVRQVEQLGFSASDVTDIVLTHADPDHAGGLSDFPAARVHIAAEERIALRDGNPRYVPAQFAHRPRWETYAESDRRWFGLEARLVALGFASEVLLVPLRGHTLGHCGVAIRQGRRWAFHVGDAYYLRAEVTREDHPVSLLAAQWADDDGLRRRSLADIRRLAREHRAEIDFFGYHDVSELPYAPVA
jgi:glyoxylase-like metal-dependent hydrolase (beta-lactamase superfamily II)